MPLNAELGTNELSQLLGDTTVFEEWLDHTQQGWLLSTTEEEYLMERKVKGDVLMMSLLIVPHIMA